MKPMWFTLFFAGVVGVEIAIKDWTGGVIITGFMVMCLYFQYEEWKKEASK